MGIGADTFVWDPHVELRTLGGSDITTVGDTSGTGCGAAR
jgi:hypothetical protein